MIRAIFGRTGGGKTLTLVNKMIRTLLDTERMCVTNLQELELPRLNEYLQEQREIEAKKHPLRAKPPVQLDKRLLVIPKLDTRHFYRFRAGGLVLPIVNDKDKHGKRVSLNVFNEMMETYFDVVYSKREYAVGVDYFMSECHRFFPARSYQEFEMPMNFYATQHRHLNDNVWLESQFPGQMDSNFRELAVEWYHVRNHGREVMGMFRQRAIFSWRMYYELPKGKVEPDDKGEFKLDAAGVATCYKTRGAISALADTSPEEQPKSKKLPFWCLPVFVLGGIFLLGLAVMSVPKMAEKAIGGFMGSVTKSTAAGMNDAMGTAPAGSTRPNSPTDGQRPQGSSAGQHTGDVRVAGYAISRRGGVIVTLSDGRVFTELDGVPMTLDRAGAVIAGVRYYFASPRQTVVQSTPYSAPAPVAMDSQAATTSSDRKQSSSWETDSDGVSRLTSQAVAEARSKGISR